MKTKTISLSLAALLGFQTVASATTVDRTTGMTDDAAASAREDIRGINITLRDLDASLARAAAAVQKRADEGGIGNVVASMSAVIGAGALTAAYFSFSNGKEGSGLMGAGYAVIGLGATAASAFTGGATEYFRSNGTTGEFEKDLITAQNKLQAALEQEQDPSKLALLNQIRSALDNTQKRMTEYQEDKNTKSGVRLMESATQLTGAGLLVLSATKFGEWIPNQTRTPILVAALLANVSRFVSSFSSEDAASVLQAINTTRTTLTTTQQGL